MTRAVAGCACLLWLLSAGAATAPAQLVPPVSFAPDAAGPGAALVVAADQTLLSPGGRPARSLTVTLPHGTRVDAKAVEALCGRGETPCPDTSRIGFGRFVLAVRGFADWGGDAELVWSLDASLGPPLRRGDAASVVLTSKLLALDNVAAFLTPALGTEVPAQATSVGRLIQKRSGVELRFAELPVALDVAAPVTVTPAKLELALGAVRRVRQNFVRRIKVRTLSGYEVRKVRDHRLIGHHLLRRPRMCDGSWTSQLRVGFAGSVKRTSFRAACPKP